MKEIQKFSQPEMVLLATYRTSKSFAPLQMEPTGCFAKGMGLSPILSAGAGHVL